MEQLENRKRVVIESLRPQIDSGQFPIKRTIGEKVKVHANIFCDGHDDIRAGRLNRIKIREAAKQALSDELTTTVSFYSKYNQSFSVRLSLLEIIIFKPDGGDAG
jgi:NAD kinase